MAPKAPDPFSAPSLPGRRALLPSVSDPFAPSFSPRLRTSAVNIHIQLFSSTSRATAAVFAWIVIVSSTLWAYPPASTTATGTP